MKIVFHDVTHICDVFMIVFSIATINGTSVILKPKKEVTIWI